MHGDDYDIKDHGFMTALVAAVLLSSQFGKASVVDHRKAAIRDARAIVKDSFDVCRSEKVAAEVKDGQ